MGILVKATAEEQALYDIINHHPYIYFQGVLSTLVGGSFWTCIWDVL
jgi:hypothetical protein